MCARAHVFTAFHTGYQIKDAETRPKDGAIPEWSGVKEFAASYFTGGPAAYLNRLARRQDLGLGAGVGPFDTDTARLAFAGALEAIAAMEDSKPS